MLYARIFGSKKKTTKEFNRIPVSSDIKVITYTQDGKTKYDVSYTDPVGAGERYMLKNKVEETIFTEYTLDGNYEKDDLQAFMDIEGILEYDLAREKRLDKVCSSMLNNLVERLELETTKSNGKVYSMGNK